MRKNYMLICKLTMSNHYGMRFGEMLCAVVLVLSTQSMRETGRSVGDMSHSMRQQYIAAMKILFTTIGLTWIRFPSRGEKQRVVIPVQHRMTIPFFYVVFRHVFKQNSIKLGL